MQVTNFTTFYNKTCSESSNFTHSLTDCLGDRGAIVGEKRGGAPWRVQIYRVKPDLRNVNGVEKLSQIHIQHRINTDI